MTFDADIKNLEAAKEATKRDSLIGTSEDDERREMTNALENLVTTARSLYSYMAASPFPHQSQQAVSYGSPSPQPQYHGAQQPPMVEAHSHMLAHNHSRYTRRHNLRLT